MGLGFVLFHEALHGNLQSKWKGDKLLLSFELSSLAYWGSDVLAAQVKRRGGPEQYLMFSIPSLGRPAFSSFYSAVCFASSPCTSVPQL